MTIVFSFPLEKIRYFLDSAEPLAPAVLIATATSKSRLGKRTWSALSKIDLANSSLSGDPPAWAKAVAGSKHAPMPITQKMCAVPMSLFCGPIRKAISSNLASCHLV